MSAHSRASINSISKRSGTSSRQGLTKPTSINTSVADSDQDTESDRETADSDQALSAVVGFGMKQKIEALKIRRRNDRINSILTAAARGDVAAMRKAFRVYAAMF